MRKTDQVAHMVKRGARYARRHGARMTAARTLQGVATRLAQPSTSGQRTTRSISKTPLDMLVRFSDAAAVDWTTPAPWSQSPRSIPDGQLSTAWIMSPPGESSGGHQNIARFIDFLEQAGHRVTVYLYTASTIPVDVDEIADMIAQSPSYANIKADIRLYDSRRGVDSDTDVIVATGWETAYPAYLDKSSAKRLYFVQDYEPFFYGVGSEAKLAENTYRFGFDAITAGGWLAHKLHEEFGMATRSFDFGAELANYPRTNDERRRDLFYYARPVTTRRGFEFGVMVMQEVKRRRPDVTIHMAGWDVSTYDIPFDYVNHGAMKIDQLSDLYNQCAAALVMSLTNLSLLPLELLSCGTIPVVNDAPNNRLVSDNPHIAYVPLSPQAMADRLIDILDDPHQVEKSRVAAQSVADTTWERAGQQFVQGFEELVRG